MPKWIKNTLRIGCILLVAALIIFIGLGTWFVCTPLGPMPQALMALQSDERVTVTQNDFVIFRPTTDEVSTLGVIFYPGSRVVTISYAPYLREIAENGYMVVMIPMLLNTPILTPDRALEIIDSDDYPDIKHWVLTGHSNGGQAGARFVLNTPDAVSGLVSWAGPPLDDLSGVDVPMLLVYGTEDGPTTLEAIHQRQSFPPNTEFVEIEGANHAHFGWYGEHNVYPDGVATIPHSEQQAQTIAATLAFYASLSQSD